MELAFRQLMEKKYQNQVNSIFLLSDGLDGGAAENVQTMLTQMKIKDAFTIHTFGYG